MVQDFASFIRSRLGAQELPQQQPVAPAPAPTPMPVAPPPMSMAQTAAQPRMSPEAVMAALAALQQPASAPVQAAQPPPMPAAAAMGQGARVLSPADFAAVNGLQAPVRSEESDAATDDDPYGGTWVTVSYNYQGTQYYLLVPEAQTVDLPEGAERVENGVVENDPDRVRNAEAAGERGVVGSSFSGLLSQAPPEIQGAFKTSGQMVQQGEMTDRIATPAPPPSTETTQAPVNDQGQTQADIRDEVAGGVGQTLTRLAGDLPGREGYTDSEGQKTPDLNLWEIEKVDPVKAGILRDAGISAVPVDQMVIRDAEGGVRLVPQAETAPAGAEIIIYGGKSEKPEPPPLTDNKIFGKVPIPNLPLGLDNVIEGAIEGPVMMAVGGNEALGDPLGFPQRKYHEGLVEYADIIANLPGPLQQAVLGGIDQTPLGPGSGDFVRWQLEHRDIVDEVRANGYNGFEGNEAVWERFQADRNLVERTADTILTDPLNVAPSTGAPARAVGERILRNADAAGPIGGVLRRGVGGALNVAADVADVPENVLNAGVDVLARGAKGAFRQLEKTPLFQQTDETIQRNVQEEAETQLDDVIAQRNEARLEEPEAGRYVFDDGSVATRGDDGSYTLTTDEGDVLLEDATWDAVQLRHQADTAARSGARVAQPAEATTPTPPQAEPEVPLRRAVMPDGTTATIPDVRPADQRTLPTDRPIDDLGTAPDQEAVGAGEELSTDRPVDDLGEAEPIRADAEFRESDLGRETDAELETWPEFLRPQTASDRVAGKNRVGVDFSARPVDMARAMASEIPDKWRTFMKEYGRRLKGRGGYAARETERRLDKSWKDLERSTGDLIPGFDLKRTYEVLMEADHMIRQQARIFMRHFGDEAELPAWSWKRWADSQGGSVHTAMDTVERTAREGGDIPLNEQVEVAIFHPDDAVAEDALDDVVYRLGVHNEDGSLKVTRSGQPVYTGKLDPRLRGMKGQPGIFTQVKKLREEYKANLAESAARVEANPDILRVDDVNQLSRLTNAEVGIPREQALANEDPEGFAQFETDLAAGEQADIEGEAVFEQDLARSLDDEAAGLDPEGAAIAARDEAATAFEDAAQPGPAALPYRSEASLAAEEAIPMGPPGWSGRPQPMQGPEAPMQGPRALSPDEAAAVRAGEATPEMWREGIEKVRSWRTKSRESTSAPSPTLGERIEARGRRAADRLPANRRRSMANRNTSMREDELQSFYVRGRVPSATQMQTLGQEFANGESLIERWDRYTSENLAKMDAAGLSIDDAERNARDQVLNDWAVENLTPEQMARYEKEFAKAKKLKNAQGTPYTDVEARIEALEHIHDRAGRTKLGYKYDNFMSALREVFLYNALTGPRYIQTQALGNSVTAILTKHYGVVGDTISPRAVKRAVEAAVRKGEAPPSLMREALDQYGLGGKRSLVTGSNAVRDQTSGTIDDAMRISKIPVIGKYTGPLASKTVRDISAMFDVMPREALHVHIMDTNMLVARKTLRERMLATAPAGRADEVGEMLDAMPQRFSASDLRDTFGEIDAKWADRHARDWQEALSKTDKAARDEVKRVFFDGGERNIDRHLKRVFFFHYWMSRATPLYTEAILRDPVYLYNYLNLLEAMEDDDDLSGSDFVTWFKTPMGYNTLIRPDAFFQAFGSFMEDAGYTPDGESWLGEALRKSPVMVNPIMNMLVNMSGMAGDTFAPDPLGLNKFIQAGQASIDYANARFGWNLPPVGNGSDQAMTWLRSQITGKLDFLPGIREVPYSDPMAYKENEVRSIVAQIGLERGLPVDDPVVQASMLDPSSEMYQEAMKRYSQQDLLDIALRILPVSAVLYPKAQYAPPKERTRDINAGKDPVTGDYSQEALDLMHERNMIAAPNEHAQQMVQQEQEYADLGTPEERGATKMYYSITFASATSPITIGGTTYTPQQLQAMEDGDREALADQWAEETGNTERVETVREARKAYREAHPEYAAFTDWRNQIRDYPGSVIQWWRDTTERTENAPDGANPNATRWYESLDDDDKTNEIELTSVEAWMAFQGDQLAYWEPQPIETRSETPPGPYNPIGDGDGGGGDGGSSSGGGSRGPTKDAILQQIEEYNAEMEQYNAVASQMLGGDQPVNVDLINPMARQAVIANLESIGVARPRMGGYLYDYLQWSEMTGNTSLDAYLTWYRQQHPEEESNGSGTEESAAAD